MTAVFATFPYRASPDQFRSEPARHPVVVIGAGPVGLSLAIDLGQRGVPVVLLDDSDRIGEGSRAICFAKKTLEIFDRLGCAAPMVEKGVSWSRGRVFQREGELYAFDLLPEAGHKMPAFINLQQFHVEKMLIDRALAVPGLDLRWKNRVVGVAPAEDHVEIRIETPDGLYSLRADHVVACDGARSPVRSMLGLDFAGEVFEEQFLIADVRMQGNYPTERWFWFDPPFHPGGSALLHRQPDDIWRIDLQLPATADAEFEKRPEQVRPRIERMLGHGRFDLEWVSIYRFRCLRLQRFVQGRVIFAGDSAHQVSPFGARGANSGVQDAENLAWKLAAIHHGRAGPGLLESYDCERGEAADENIGHSTRSTDFIAPQSPAERVLRDAALALARRHDFAKRMVNSGRLSAPTAYHDSPLSTPDAEPWSVGPAPGAPIPDARVARPDGTASFLSEELPAGFVWLEAGSALADLPEGAARLRLGPGALGDPAGEMAARFGFDRPGGYLLRPDRHVAARFREPDPARLRAALARAHASGA
ncbi:FAD-dependent oxidoreductase [Rhabdaerophilum sp. SD176]|uniref:FAD-dependent oxidoreductase n=1 Tax=Rhabdaerophilum sp. SD176 TaxID=2983548 RepID=UPI0024DF37E7|nr:FAD-dependent oxidoreductase [Rhabdaerophilum sp. SD176]